MILMPKPTRKGCILTVYIALIDKSWRNSNLRKKKFPKEFHNKTKDLTHFAKKTVFKSISKTLKRSPFLDSILIKLKNAQPSIQLCKKIRRCLLNFWMVFRLAGWTYKNVVQTVMSKKYPKLALMFWCQIWECWHQRNCDSRWIEPFKMVLFKLWIA